MPDCFEVNAASGAYTVNIQGGLFKGLHHQTGEVVVLADERFAPQLLEAAHDVVAVTANETSKELERIPKIVAQLRKLGTNRNTMLIAVGGGVVQDIAGFVASIYMRGLTWTYYPTTLLGMADSCIGGKSSINVGKYKNLVGTFHPPRRIEIDPELTRTLSVEQRVAGLCEAAKICFCRAPEAFDDYLMLKADVDSDIGVLEQVLARSLKAKIWFIQVDEFDQAERLVLNFGHTFGHALETATSFNISHGVAVGLGTLAALDYGRRLGRRYDPNGCAMRFAAHIEALLARVPGISAELAKIDEADLLDAFAADKKHTRKEFALVLVAEDDRVERVLVEKNKATLRRVAAAFASLRGVRGARERDSSSAIRARHWVGEWE